MKTLSIISHKGGAGKTSSTVMLAEDLARRGLRVVLVDADRQKGAGLILGIEQPNGTLQQTRNPRLRYLCSSSLPLRELPTRARELGGQFDVAVVDTPSLDDPLARGWIQLSTHVLMAIPVEPVSMKTLEGVDTALENASQLNPGLEVVGMLPTMFDESDATQRTLMLELQSRRPEGLLPAIPLDSGLAHRAEQKAERRTEPAEATRQAYQVATDALVRALGLGGQAAQGGVSVSGWTQKRAAPVSSQPEPQSRPDMPVAPAGKPFRLGLALAVVAALVLLVLGLGKVLIQSRRAQSPAKKGSHAAASITSAVVRGGVR